jgi:hypothetical protein
MRSTVMSSLLWLCALGALLGCICFQLQVLLAFGNVARQAWMEMLRSGRKDTEVHSAVKRAIATVGLSAASALTIILYVLCNIIVQTSPSDEMTWLFQVTSLLNVSFNLGLAIVCAGLAGPAGDREADFATTRRLAVSRRVRLLEQGLSQVIGSSSGPALTVAALIGGKDPRAIIRDAVARFRCVSWDVWSQMPKIITDAGLLDGQQASYDVYVFV